MKITVTFREANQKINDFYGFCNEFGYNPYAMNEGMDPETELELTKEQAIKYGLLEDQS